METARPLDDRKARILREIVETYVRLGEPVGSHSIADTPDLGVSSATVRNEMGILEREGYISQPHTSAGRVPTDKGYRYYVDAITPHGSDPIRVREIEGELTKTLSALDELLAKASGILSELTSYTSLASAPPVDRARVRHVQMIGLGGSRIFLVVVGEGAWHAERLIELELEPPDTDIRRAVELVNNLVCGRSVAEAASELQSVVAGTELQPLIAGTAAALQSLSGAAGRVFTGGASRLVVWEPAPIAQRVLEILEDGEYPHFFPVSSPDSVHVRIGHELNLDDYHELSLIAAGYRFGKQAGTLGVLGPTRMDYPLVISTVSDVAGCLSRVLRRLDSSD